MKDFRKTFELGARTRAVILGKGPSYERVAEVADSDYEAASHLWLGINQAMRHPRVEAGIALHTEPVEEVIRLGYAKPLIMPLYPLYGWNQARDKALSDYEFLKPHDEAGLLYSFVPYYCADKAADPNPVQGFGTTAHYALQMLAEMSVKEFIFFGVDGGLKAYGKKYYADGFRHDDKRYFESGKIPANFDEMWGFYFQLRRKYGLRYTFV